MSTKLYILIASVLLGFLMELFWVIPFAEQHENEVGYSKHYLKVLYGMSTGWTIMIMALPIYWIITTSAIVSPVFIILVFVANNLVKMQLDNIYIKCDSISLFFKEFVCVLLILLMWNALIFTK